MADSVSWVAVPYDDLVLITDVLNEVILLVENNHLQEDSEEMLDLLTDLLDDKDRVIETEKVGGIWHSIIPTVRRKK